jgi:membrane fusion protein (multidrug efflux system)
VQRDALLVPQRAVSELQGGYQVAAVDDKNKVSIRTVKVGDRVGSQWIIADGVKPGERVIAEGVQKVRAGMQVNPKHFAVEATGK